MYYRYFRWLSLDIVLGALIFLKFLANFYQVIIPIQVYLALAIAIWEIYTIDHLIDAHTSRYLDQRRTFHRRHERILILVSGILAVVGLVNIYFLPIEIIRSGVILTAACVSYLMMVYFFRKLWFKEILIAIGYACGIFLAPFSLYHSIGFFDFILYLQLATLAFINLLIFSYFDQENDRKSGFGSVMFLMENRSIPLIRFLLLIVSVSCTYFIIFHPEKYQSIQLAYLIMALLFFAVINFHYYFEKQERFRVLGDAVFFVPALFLVF